MTHYLIRRTFWAFFLFVVATMITYVIFFVVPADPATLAAGKATKPEIVAHIRKMLHLNLPIYQQYWLFVWNLVRHGSFGYSFVNGLPVRTMLGQEIPVTASIVFGGVILYLAIAIPTGVISALRPRSILDRTGMVFVLVGISAPSVWIGLILLYLVGFKLGWTPIGDYCDFLPHHQIGVCSGPGQWAYHLILPWITLAVGSAALYTRLIRANVMETMTEDYVRTAHAKGASPARVLVQHVLRNSMLQVVTILGMDLGLLLGGVVFIEIVFGLPGLGQQLVQAAPRFDLPVIVGIVMFATLAVIVFNFVVDVLYAWLDPRIRLA
ncbi:MAG TPA: ABC transporter permease [Gaiellaceae bacterium]|nr:ABC transporter permease [Gaiellaceae bacterium]